MIDKDTVKEVVEWIESNLPEDILTTHYGRTYYSILPEFAALNGLSPEDVEIEKEYTESCLHCRWQAKLKERGIE